MSDSSDIESVAEDQWAGLSGKDRYEEEGDGITGDEVMCNGYDGSYVNHDTDGSESDSSESELEDASLKNYMSKRNAKVFEPDCPMTDIIAHAFLPNVTPNSEQKNLGVVESHLLEMALTSISSVLEENEISELEQVKDMFEKWVELQSKGDTSDGAAFVKLFQKMGAYFKEGDTIPLYVKMQNATLLITKLADGNMRISTFRTSLPSKVIMSNINSLIMTFPETSEVIQNTDLLTSPNFLLQLFELTTKAQPLAMPVTQKGTGDVPDPFLVSDWIVGCLAPVNPSESPPPVFCQKKMRDQVNLKIDAHSSSNIPFRRSGMWMSIKVGLQLKLLEIFGDDHKDEANFLYKIIILRILTDICENYLIHTTPMNLDMASQMVTKVGRRIVKLSRMVNVNNNEDGESPKIRWRDLSIGHTHSTMKQVTGTLKSQWKKMIRSCDIDKAVSGSCSKHSGAVIQHSKEEFLKDLNHKIPWLDAELDSFMKNPGYGNVVTTADHNTLSKQPEVERYSTLQSILDSSGKISRSRTFTTGKVDNYVKTRVWLHDTEHFVKTRLHLEGHDQYNPNYALFLKKLCF